MRILFITMAFAPDEFSESIVNSKLVIALMENGHQVDVISRKMQGLTYSSEWHDPWIPLKSTTIQIEYKIGSKIYRFIDFIRCSLIYFYPMEGVRWADRAVIKAIKLIKVNKYDIIITRSPSDISHIVGLKLKKRFKIPWLANWNDPSNGILPKPYKNNSNSIINCFSHHFTRKILRNADLNTFPCKRLRSYFLYYYNFNIEKSEIMPHISIDFIKGNSHKTFENNLLICHAGNLSEERDPEVLFKTISRINKDRGEWGVKLCILGIVTDRVIKLINKYSLHQDVKLLNNKPYLDGLHIMKDYDVLCIIEAKLNEGIFLPSKLSDYIVLNKPILCISPGIGTLVDIIDEYGGGLVVNNEDEESVYAGIKKLINFKKKGQMSGMMPLNKLRAYLSEEELIRKYNILFNKIL